MKDPGAVASTSQFSMGRFPTIVRLLATLLVLATAFGRAASSTVQRQEIALISAHTQHQDFRVLSSNASGVCDKMDFPVAQAMALSVVSLESGERCLAAVEPDQQNPRTQIVLVSASLSVLGSFFIIFSYCTSTIERIIISFVLSFVLS